MDTVAIIDVTSTEDQQAAGDVEVKPDQMNGGIDTASDETSSRRAAEEGAAAAASTSTRKRLGSYYVTRKPLMSTDCRSWARYCAWVAVCVVAGVLVVALLFAVGDLGGGAGSGGAAEDNQQVGWPRRSLVLVVDVATGAVERNGSLLGGDATQIDDL